MPFELFRKPETKDIPTPYPPFPQARAIDPFSTQRPNEKPIVVTYMHMSKGTTSMPFTPLYECDETGVVLEGALTIEDEKGNVATLKVGDSFFVKRGSKILFGSESAALVVKVAGRYDGEGWAQYEASE
ncbi:hypothetical protein F4820DRAFT_309547 [Hypoxylon rubiginosum]|uniref:Uncharacterized protein n=1 Tax=Hypoxylon rubiginosum TaxID=110542 RepID=A0ACB9Z032_9PEZI|nr:hypothetical protein F4820DRAFT_309547 [Hypoxylon rubiginosum]